MSSALTRETVPFMTLRLKARRPGKVAAPSRRATRTKQTVTAVRRAGKHGLWAKNRRPSPPPIIAYGAQVGPLASTNNARQAALTRLTSRNGATRRWSQKRLL